MTTMLTTDRLTELRDTSLPPATLEHIGLSLTPEAGDEDAAKQLATDINEYLSAFVAPQRRDGEACFATSFAFGDCECICCGASLNGMLGSFTYGFAWGEGYCSKCKWPCRALHVIKSGGMEIFDKPLSQVLQYHPSQVQMRNEIDPT